jgi:hypothetical protein
MISDRNQDAEKRFKQEERARDGRKAVAEYETQARATRAKTERLKASVHHARCPHARARGWGARCCSTCSGRLVGAAAAGRTMVRSPAAPSPFLFSGLLFADSGSGRRWSSSGRGDR